MEIHSFVIKRKGTEKVIPLKNLHFNDTVGGDRSATEVATSILFSVFLKQYRKFKEKSHHLIRSFLVQIRERFRVAWD